jgi:actin-related protein 3
MSSADNMSIAPNVCIDVGTGYIKAGYCGNEEPSWILPSVYADSGRAGKTAGAEGTLDDLDFSIGQEALDRPNATCKYPVEHGIVTDWDKMERIWQHMFYKYMRIEPQEHGFVLTEPPANPPENRELTAEVMFETFGAKQLLIAVQGVLALTASWNSKKATQLGLAGLSTGTVIDSGAGVTHVIPIVDGYVIGNAIRHIPLAGRDITNFVLEKLRERNATLPSDEALAAAQRVKERYCYVSKNMDDEFNAYDDDPASHFRVHRERHRKTGAVYEFDVGYEQFLGPEVFFSPDIFSTTHTTPLPQVVDDVIQSCPIDARKGLYKNIVLSGGTTMFRNFHSRLQRDLRELVRERLGERADKMAVNVVSHERQRYAVWYGGSVVGSGPQFNQVAITKAQYDEEGPAVCRRNAMFAG